MPSKGASEFTRILRKNGYYASTKPRTRPSQKRKKKIAQTPAEKVLNAERRRKHREELKVALQDARKAIMQEATNLREKFGGHSIEYYYEQIIQSSRMERSKRKVNMWNVFVKQETDRINMDLPESERKKAHQVTPSASIKWAQMSRSEQKAATRDGVAALEAFREEKLLAKQNVPLQSFHDTRTALTNLEREILALHARTGTECVLLSVRSSKDHFNQPHVVVSSPRVTEFFNLAVKEPVEDFAIRFEAFCLSGIQGVAANYVQTTLDMKSRVASLILSKLCEAAKCRVPRMYYKNFDENITAKFGVILEGWPLAKFCNPSEIVSRVEVQLLENSIKSGATRFRRLTTAELDAWEQKWFEAAVSQTEEQPAPPAAVQEVHEVPPGSPSLPSSENPANDAAQHSTETPASPTSSDPTVSAKRTAPDPNAPPAKRRKAPLDNMVNFGFVTGPDGTAVPVEKRRRKERSDKGKKRGPQGKEN